MPRARRPTMSSGSASSDVPDDREKICLGCNKMCPASCYYANVGGKMALGARCKECVREYGFRQRGGRKPEDGDEETPDDDDDPQAKRPKVSEPAASDLYVMALSTDPSGAVHGFKVGRSSNIQQRSFDLSSSMPFTILVLATFPGAGHLERSVHTLLAPTRNTAGRGREWFQSSLTSVLHAVTYALQSQPNVNAGPATNTPDPEH
jgi:hypothetical protein